MTSKHSDLTTGETSNPAPLRPAPPPAALRALAEAQARRALAAAELAAEPAEIGGPKGLDPTRFGDWERKGLAVDF